MPSNEAFVFSFKGQNGYIPIYPNTPKAKVKDWTMGEVYGPFQVSLPASGWDDNSQTVALNGVTDTDVVYCVNILSGTQEEMQEQMRGYLCLDPQIGVQSQANSLVFTCTNKVPTVDLVIQVEWVR